MFKLTEAELQNAHEAIEHHGYSTLLPTPPEWLLLRDQWAEIKKELSETDLDVYSPVLPLRVYAPKTRATVRIVSLLHPVDLILYTALTLLVKDDLESARVPPSKQMIFSYRTERGVNNRLYSRANSYAMFRERLRRKSHQNSVRYVALADIADFYPRIHQHRLENIVETCASTPRGRSVARVLVKKLISKLSDSNSYGIPIGPYASRILAEAWRHSPNFVRVFRDHRSDLVRRMAALAIASNGSRADALETRDRFAAASPLEQLAILTATKRLGTDERRHWKTSLQLKGPLEKRI